MKFAKGNKAATGGKRRGAGRKKSTVRELCAKEFEKRVPILCEIADSAEQQAKDRIAAIRELARIGVPDQHELVDGDGETIRFTLNIEPPKPREDVK